MKRLVLSILCLMMTLNSFAASAGKNDLTQVFDDYQYSVTVDWDQKDEKALTELTNAFYKNLDLLMLEKGMDVNEIEKLLEARIKDKKLVEATKLKLRLIGSNPSRADVIKFLAEEGKQMYAHGSSWNGEAVAIYSFGIVFVAIAAYAIYFRLTHNCVRWEEDTDNLICTYDTINGPCSGGSCGAERCYYEDYCAEWVKK